MPIIKEEEFNDENEFVRQLMNKDGVDRKFSCSSNDSCTSSIVSSDYTFDNPFNQSIDDGKIELEQKRSCPSLSSSAAVEIQLSEQQQSKIQNILDSVQALTDAEKFFLFLKLPLKEQQSSVSLSNSKWEQTQAFQWIRNNLEECDININLPKHEVYDEYKLFCEKKGSKRFLSAPDFGKIVKCMFPNVKARRLGTRGHSKYCYSGLQRKSMTSGRETKVTSNATQNVSSTTSCDTEESLEQIFGAACKVVCEWANKLLGRCFNTLLELAKFLVNGSYVSTKSMSSFIVMSANPESLVKCQQREPQKFKSLEEICTPSKTVMGNKPKQQQHVTPSKTTQVVPIPSTNNCLDNKKSDISLDEFSIDVNAPVFLDEQNISSSHPKVDHTPGQVLMNNVKVHIKQEIIDSPSDPTYRPATPPLTPNRDERRQQRNHPITANKTPKKVGRPCKNKSSPYASPNKQRIKQTVPATFAHNAGQQLHAQLPVNRFPIQNRPMQGFELPFHQQQMLFDSTSLPGGRQMGSPLPPFVNGPEKFMNPQTPPHHQIINNNNRCQSVPVSQKGSNAAFHPLTPQFHRINNERDQQQMPLNAKRNLNFVFDNPKCRDAVLSEPNGFSRQNPVSVVLNQDHLVPTNQHQQITSFPPTTTIQTSTNNQPNMIYDLGFPLNDLSTPEEMADIPAGFDNIDGDDLIKSLNQTNMTTWANDWSNSSIPFMNVNCR